MTERRRLKEKRQLRVTYLLTLIVMILGVCLAGAQRANSQTIPDMIVLNPNTITGEYDATTNSNTNDSRLMRICIYRIDSNSPDPDAEVACADASTGVTPRADQESPSGDGMVYTIRFSTVLVAGQDQLFIARNIADVGGGVEILSANSLNSAFIPSAIGPPMFIIVSP